MSEAGGGDLFIVDNSVSGWTGLEYLSQWTDVARSFDIATGFFEIGALLALDGKWQQLERIRLLMGDEVSLRTHNVFKEALAQRVGRLDGSLESEKVPNPFLEGVEAVVQAIAEGRIECRVYRKDKFHAKAYITHAKFDVVGAQALVGSSNFTRPGLTRNVELNIQVQSGREVAQLQDWFETHWAAAEDVTADVLRTITRHTAEFTPFDVYSKALHEFFRGRELTAGEWDESQSRMFGQLDRYQQEAVQARTGSEAAPGDNQGSAPAVDRPKLCSVVELKVGDEPEDYEQYGYRSLDRQWVIADQRLIDRAGPELWRIRGSSQVFLTTLTSTKLGQGPALTVTPYVPDLHHFRGSYGAKNVMPLHRNAGGNEPNVADGLLEALSAGLATEVAAEDLLAYVYSLGATAAFTDRFNKELAEAAGPIHIPITADPDLFRQAVSLGRDLLWWHTWGERFAPDGEHLLPEGSAREVSAVDGMPNDFDYDSESETLTVGTGTFAPVSKEAWDFEVSGLRALRSWLRYRMKTRKGRKSSPLDDIRPTRWTQSKELLLVLSIIEHTIEVTPQATALLAKIVEGPLIPAADLPTPTPANRKPPRL